MRGHELYELLCGDGLAVRRSGDELFLSPKDKVTARHRELIKAHRAELLKHMRWVDQVEGIMGGLPTPFEDAPGAREPLLALADPKDGYVFGLYPEIYLRSLLEWGEFRKILGPAFETEKERKQRSRSERSLKRKKKGAKATAAKELLDL